MQQVLEKIKKKHLVSRYILMLFALFLSAICFNLFQLPTQIVAGGTNGISVITNYLFDFDPSMVILGISLIMLVISFAFLGWEATTGTVLATLVYPFFVKLTSSIGVYLRFDTSDMILVSIVIGFLGGITSGIVYKTGFSSGGLQILSQIIFKYAKISISKSSLIINGIVVLLGGIFLDWTNVLYAIIIVFINSLMIDKVMSGSSQNKAFYIITKKPVIVKKYIIESLNYGVTLFKVQGGFLDKKEDVLMTVIPTRDYFRLTEGIKPIDPEAFFVAMDAYEVKGGKMTKNFQRQE